MSKRTSDPFAGFSVTTIMEEGLLFPPPPGDKTHVGVHDEICKTCYANGQAEVTEGEVVTMCREFLHTGLPRQHKMLRQLLPCV